MFNRIRSLSTFLFVADLAITPVSMAIAEVLRRTIPLGRGGALSEAFTDLPWPVYVLAILSWGVALVSARAYDPERVLRWYNETLRVLWGSVLGTMILAGLLYLSFRQVSRLQFAYFFLINLLLLLAYRALLRIYHRLLGRAQSGGRARVIIVGAGRLGQAVGQVLLDHSRWGFDILGYLDDDPEKLGNAYESIPVIGTTGDILEIVKNRRIEEIWIALPADAHERLTMIVRLLEKLPVRIKIVPDYFSLALITAKPDMIGGLPVVGLREPIIEGWARIVKRVFDVVVATVVLVPALPLMALIALAIRLDSKGPVIFRQQRLGENGELFNMLKFRTMIEGSGGAAPQEKPRPLDESGVHKVRDDPRVTRVGRLLRRFSLDELPQLLNVVKGEMSLVGPRPELPWLVDQYESWQRKRFAVPQGLTGWWQINGRSDKPMHLNVEDDLYYVLNYSLWLDILILLRTPFVVLRGEGAF